MKKHLQENITPDALTKEEITEIDQELSEIEDLARSVKATLSASAN